VHKSYIVSLDKIDSIERNRIFIGEVVIPVGETFKENFSSMIENMNSFN
jgi:two-component system, LytTR family, response regulator